MKLPPAILLVVSLLLLSLGLTSGYLLSGNFLGGQGQFNFSYTAGSSPVTSITFTLPHDLASSIAVDGAGGGFTPSLQGDTLTLTGSYLQVGQSLVVDYHLDRYIDPGNRNYSIVALTGNGQSIPTTGIANVEPNVLLEIFTTIFDNSLPIDALGAVGAVGAGAWIVRDSLREKDSTPLLEAPEPGTSSPTETPPTTGSRPLTQEKPTETPTGDTNTVPTGGGNDKFPAPTTEEKKKPKKLGVDLTMCPKDWIPEGTNTVSFTAVVYMCVDGSGWVPSDTPARITFKLLDVSNQPGICLNKGHSKSKDLWFPEKENPNFGFEEGDGDSACEEKILGVKNKPHKHFQKAWTKEAVTKATVVVRSEDFGAWGAIEATAEGCTEIPPRANASSPVNCPGPVCCVGSNKVSIPFDTNGNHIPDASPHDKCGAGEAGAKKDDDSKPSGDGTNGDGLTAYEEYRGFFVNEGEGNGELHIRTDMDKKDVFVYIDDKKLDRLDYFRRTGLEVHRIFDPKLVNGEKKHEINFNRDYATGGLQHALWLSKNNNLLEYGRACGEKDPEGIEGSADPEIAVPGTPRTKSHICVNLDRCTKGKDFMGAARPADRLDQVIAHELSHGVNLPHHGEGVKHGHPHSGQQEPDYYYMKGELPSGVVDCIMRYDQHSQGWCEGDPDNMSSHVRHQTYWDPQKKKWLEKPGTHYCSSQTGDGVNKVGASTNDATKGNCQNLIKVKDW